MKNTLIVLGITVVVLGILGFGIYEVMQNQPGQKTVSQPVDASDHVLGNPATAKITLVEYGDYQCPACGYFHPIVKKLMTEYQDRVLLAFRNFPLSQHPNAIPAANAAEAAAKQGKFWEMHDLIYEHQNDWSEQGTAADLFRQYAQQLQLNMSQYDKDVASGDVSSRIQHDLQTGRDSSVDSTPSFFLNGIYIQPNGYDEFKQLLDGALSS